MGVKVRRIVACFDGTWNTDKSNTNVSRLFRLIADGTTGCPEQRRLYDEGVGTGFGERVRGGALGIGLDANIRQGYAWLGSQFGLAASAEVDSDKFLIGPDIFLFGFSRGAFTARSLGGMINYLGLPKLGSKPQDPPAKSPQEDIVVLDAWHLYEARPTDDERKAARDGADAKLAQRVADHDAAVIKHRADHSLHPVRIHFLGVWDTVGALGIPRVFDKWSLMRPSTKYRFHDTRLGRCVRFAYHAVAIDEHREPYCVTLWTGHEPTTEEVEQRWFPGAHADVGGGYEDDLLPDPPLAWVATKAAAQGLHFVNDRGWVDPQTGERPPSVARVPAAFELDGREYLSAVHDSYAEFMGGSYKLLRALPGAGGRTYRRMLVEQDGVAQTVYETANKKISAEGTYRPPNLSQAGRLDVSYRIARLDE
jgi:uncharacterized protein (DUF2235 family)